MEGKERKLEGAGKPRVLVVEDEPTILEFLETGLRYEGYAPTAVREGKRGLELALEEAFDVIILDIMLPDMDGFEICRRIRERGETVSILMLTAKKEIEDRVTGLDAGADDYLTKPFSFKELLARLRALLRRSDRYREPVEFRAAGITLNVETREVRREGNLLSLTPTEFELLKMFMQHPRRVFTRETLLNRVWGYHYIGDANIVDVHVSHLREKLGDKPPRLIRTHYGVGYSFHPEEAA